MPRVPTFNQTGNVGSFSGGVQTGSPFAALAGPVGEGLQDLGSGVLKLQRAQAAEKQFTDETVVRETSLRFQAEATEIETELELLQGIDARNVREDYRQRMEDLEFKHIRRLDNEEQKFLFKGQTATHTLSGMSRLGKHERSEKVKSHEASLAAEVGNSARDAQDALPSAAQIQSGNLESTPFGLAMASVSLNVEQLADVRGYTSEQTEQLFDETSEAFHSGNVTKYLQGGDVEGAIAYADKFGGNVPAGVTAKWDAAVSRARVSEAVEDGLALSRNKKTKVLDQVVLNAQIAAVGADESLTVEERAKAGKMLRETGDLQTASQNKAFNQIAAGASKELSLLKKDPLASAAYLEKQAETLPEEEMVRLREQDKRQRTQNFKNDPSLLLAIQQEVQENGTITFSGGQVIEVDTPEQLEGNLRLFGAPEEEIPRMVAEVFSPEVDFTKTEFRTMFDAVAPQLGPKTRKLYYGSSDEDAKASADTLSSKAARQALFSFVQQNLPGVGENESQDPNAVRALILRGMAPVVTQNGDSIPFATHWNNEKLKGRDPGLSLRDVDLQPGEVAAFLAEGVLPEDVANTAANQDLFASALLGAGGADDAFSVDAEETTRLRQVRSATVQVEKFHKRLLQQMQTASTSGRSAEEVRNDPLFRGTRNVLASHGFGAERPAGVVERFVGGLGGGQTVDKLSGVNRSEFQAAQIITLADMFSEDGGTPINARQAETYVQIYHRALKLGAPKNEQNSGNTALFREAEEAVIRLRAVASGGLQE